MKNIDLFFGHSDIGNKLCRIGYFLFQVATNIDRLRSPTANDPSPTTMTRFKRFDQQASRVIGIEPCKSSEFMPKT